MYLKNAIFVNIAPFGDKLELTFEENEIAVLAAVNGKGKTTILSHIVDAFHEMSKFHFQDFEDKQTQNKYYRISSAIYNNNIQKPSFVYLRFAHGSEVIDYINIRNMCTEEEYNEAITLENKIPFTDFQETVLENKNIKALSSNFNKQLALNVFSNIATYFPSYRYEKPYYLNDPYQVKVSFKTNTKYTNYLENPIEVVSGLESLINWVMDIVLDIRWTDHELSEYDIATRKTYSYINTILSSTLVSKQYGDVYVGVGGRNSGGMRVQVTKKKDDGSIKMIYPSIFNISSGEAAILSIFGEILRQGDNNHSGIAPQDIHGIVLIDEIDKHLHIKLQKEALPKLLALFPNIQFIISSHSPFLSMGLAEELQNRSKVVDLETGLAIEPTSDAQYIEVYNMMLGENQKFKQAYESIKNQVNREKRLQIVTEGKNTEHIKKAIQINKPGILEKIQIVEGAEGKTGQQQLKNAFDVIKRTDHSNKFLFVRDCDSVTIVDSIQETENFKKFCFTHNTSSKAKKGIENLYSQELFTDDLYTSEPQEGDYGEVKIIPMFNKNMFLEKIRTIDDPNIFAGFMPLIEKISELLEESEQNSVSHQPQ